MDFFSIYGRYGSLDSLKRLSRDVGTFSTPGKPHSENFLKSTFSTPSPHFFSDGAIRKGSYPRGQHGSMAQDRASELIMVITAMNNELIMGLSEHVNLLRLLQQ